MGSTGLSAFGPGLITAPLQSTLSAVADLPVVSSLPVVGSVTHTLPSEVQQVTRQATGQVTRQATGPVGAQSGNSPATTTGVPHSTTSATGIGPADRPAAGSAAATGPVTGLGSYVDSGGLASALRTLR